MEERSKGQIAYDAYFRQCGGKSLISGAALPEWKAQSDDIREAWEQAGRAVIQSSGCYQVKLEGLQKAMDRLIRFNKALIQMGAIETAEALEAELTIAWKMNEFTKREQR